MRIYLVRHPKPLVPGGVCYGASDLPLVHTPELAVAQTKPLLPANAPLYSSPLQRCRVLAEALHPRPIFDDRLREINFGRWEMQPWERISIAALDDWAVDPLNFRDHGGESVMQMRERIAAFIQTLPQDNVVLVTHSGVMKLFFAILLNWPTEDWLDLHFDYASVSCLESGIDGKYGLVWHNSVHANNHANNGGP